MKKLQKLMPSLFTILVGVLFVMLKSAVIPIAIKVIGIGLVVLAVLALFSRNAPSCIVYAVMAVLVFVAGGLFVNVAFYVVAAVLLIRGVTQLYALVTDKSIRSSVLTLILFIAPLLNIAAGVCLLLDLSATLSWIFILVGIMLIIDGVLSLADVIEGKNNKKRRRR